MIVLSLPLAKPYCAATLFPVPWTNTFSTTVPLLLKILLLNPPVLAGSLGSKGSVPIYKAPETNILS